MTRYCSLFNVTTLCHRRLKLDSILGTDYFTKVKRWRNILLKKQKNHKLEPKICLNVFAMQSRQNKLQNLPMCVRCCHGPCHIQSHFIKNEPIWIFVRFLSEICVTRSISNGNLFISLCSFFFSYFFLNVWLRILPDDTQQQGNPSNKLRNVLRWWKKKCCSRKGSRQDNWQYRNKKSTQFFLASHFGRIDWTKYKTWKEETVQQSGIERAREKKNNR